ncbi:MAG: hypothetical protein EZS28_017483, partial [Streblomastix strix]
MEVESVVTYMTMPLPQTIADGEKIKGETDTVSEGDGEELAQERKKEEEE